MIIIDDFLPEKCMTDIENIVTNRILCQPNQALRGWTNLTWADRLKNNSSLIWIAEIADYPEIIKAIDTVLDQRHILPEARPVRYQICAWYRGSSLPWHIDEHASFSATLHLRDWDVQHGGLFFWRDPKGVLQVTEPKRNRCVVVDKQEQHMVSQVTYDAPGPRFTIQIWGSLFGNADATLRHDYLSYQ